MNKLEVIGPLCIRLEACRHELTRREFEGKECTTEGKMVNHSASLFGYRYMVAKLGNLIQ